MRPKTFRRDEVIQKALPDFWAKGYTATSIEDVFKITGIRQGSFYREFENGKKEIFEEAIKKYYADKITPFEAKARTNPDPIQVIRDFFATISDSDRSEHQLGCLIGNTAVEMSCIDDVLQRQALAMLEGVETIFVVCIERAKSMKKITSKMDSQIIALQLINLWNGLNITRRMYPDKGKMKSIIAGGLEILR